MLEPVDQDFVDFCQLATNKQLEEILRKEFKAKRADDYAAACNVAAQRGWTVNKGERL
jgi:hypothetical protein